MALEMLIRFQRVTPPQTHHTQIMLLNKERHTTLQQMVLFMQGKAQ
jgi:hypothetical protein